MKLHATPTAHYQTITAYDEKIIKVNNVPFSHSFFVLPQTPPKTWAVADFKELEDAHFEDLIKQQPDLIIVGTGMQQLFIAPKLIQGLMKKNIGVECMNNHAACRTYNILMAEGRHVALALILPSN
jgi:uncharacterized protein